MTGFVPFVDITAGCPACGTDVTWYGIAHLDQYDHTRGTTYRIDCPECDEEARLNHGGLVWQTRVQ